MINSIKLRNFQSHKKTNIEFSDGVNIILGTSDSGKSAIFRSLIWLCYNRPLGDNIRYWDSKKTTVKGLIQDTEIKRTKSNKENSYTITKADEKPITFKAIKSDIPEEVTNILKIDRKINVQAQADPFFLLSPSDSPGKVAEQFNNIVNLELIDISLKKINDIEREETRAIRALEIDIAEDIEQATKFDWIKEAEIKINTAEDLEKTVTIKENVFEFITETLSSISNANKRIQKAKKYTALEGKVKEAEGLKHAILNIDTKIKEISGILSDLKRSAKKVKDEKILKKLQEKIKKCEEIKTGIKSKETEYNNIKNTVGSLVNLTENKSKLVGRVTTMEKKFKRYMPKICPLCGKE